ncbi:hypothetical protein [Salinarimonas soli]|uniref:Uncharacterized protein n=1 Tax=Salinarimonas soli TaxID=1638099 RepID=A0A5B2VCF1_9HYPH|nr:hypothetical protein [Salinarimonas soli]KAA2236415.1 hypothetical protein F0L46_14835 [Salinarimonas soli]
MANRTTTHHPRDIRETRTEPRWADQGLTLGTMGIALITVGVTALAVHLASRGRGRPTRAWTTTIRTAVTGETQRDIMERALQMKRDAGPQTHIPEHVTAHEGAVHGGQVGYTDTRLGREGTFTENTGRSHGARVGDTGKTTGPGSH